MYLTCPKCQAIYEVSESLFTAGARGVRCSACENTWVAGLSTEQTINELMGESANEAFNGLNNFLGKPSQPSEPSAPATSDSGVPPLPEAAPVTLPQPIPIPSPKNSLKSLKKNYSYRPDRMARSSQNPFGMFFKMLFTAIIAVGIALALSGGAAIYFRSDIVQAVPATQPIYEFFMSFYHLAEMTLKELLTGLW